MSFLVHAVAAAFAQLYPIPAPPFSPPSAPPAAAPASPAPPSAGAAVSGPDLESRYNTIAHDLLRTEAAALAQADPQFDGAAFRPKMEVLDHLLDQARRRITYDPGVRDPRRRRAQARRILSQIEALLVQNNFLLRFPSEYVYQTLTPLPAQSGTYLVTPARRRHFQRNRNELFYHFDCDISALLYVAIGEELGMPIHMVEVPGHNFVRWRLSPAEHLNWDTNAAREYTDDEYRNGDALTSTTRFSREVERAGRYLTDMTREEIVGYHLGVSAALLSSRGRFAQAADYYERAIAARPYSTLPRNNLAWMYLLNADMRGARNHQRALELARHLADAEPHNGKYLDLLACAHAATGDFASALEAERSGYALPPKLEAFAAGHTCLDIGLR